jgi:glycosyltransferase involved in cell wall biosynthesis
MAYNRNLPEPQVTVVIPTLSADATLAECLRSLDTQTYRDLEVIIIDNSGEMLARRSEAGRTGTRIVENSRNVGFGAAVNQGFRASRAPLRWHIPAGFRLWSGPSKLVRTPACAPRRSG